MASPLPDFGPANAFFSASVCARVKQLSDLGPEQTSAAGSNAHARELNIIPSFRPSLASQAWSRQLTISLRSDGEKVCFGSGLPLASFGAASSKTAVMKPSARFECPVRMAG